MSLREQSFQHSVIQKNSFNLEHMQRFSQHDLNSHEMNQIKKERLFLHIITSGMENQYSLESL